MSQTHVPKATDTPTPNIAPTAAGPTAWSAATDALRWAQGVGGGGNGLAALMIGESAPAEARDEAPSEPSDLVAQAREWFPTLDTDEDGHLSREELGAAVTRLPTPGMIDGDALLAATLLKSSLDLEELVNDEWLDEDDGPTLADLEAIDTADLDGDERERLNAVLAGTAADMGAASGELFADPSGLVDVGPTGQGSAGDCSLISAIVSAAAQDPGLIDRMIADNGDGTYTVTFPNGQSTDVASPTPAEQAVYASAAADGQWLTVVEKAAGQLHAAASWREEALPLDAVDKVLPAWTGASMMSADGEADFDLLGLSDEDALHAKLAAGAAEGRAMVASIRALLPGEGEREDRLPTQHAYAIIGYDPQDRTVTLRNPWGRTGPNGDPNPEWTLELSELIADFSTVTVAGAAPTIAP